jgi:drug/metabolite transporter (DMT)-like permease
LVAATAVWGSTFAVTKNSLDQMSPASFLTWRFGIAAAALLLLRPGTLRTLSSAERWRGVLLGTALAAGFLLQTNGLLHTLAGVSGFLTGAAVVLTPIVAAVFFKERVGSAGWAAVVLSAAGIAGLAGSVAAPTLAGSMLTVAGAAGFAVHIAGLSQWATRANAYALTALSITIAAVLCIAVSLADSSLAAPSTTEAWRGVLYLGLVATCVGFAVQAWAQSALSATAAAVTMTMEPLFAAAIAVGLGERGIGLVGWLSGFLIVAGMGIAELGSRRCCDALSPRVECC